MSVLYELRDTRFSYNGKSVLDIEQFQIHTGSITAVIGANGSGKTTLLNLLALLQLPKAGVLKYKNNLISPENFNDLRKNIGYIQQKPYLLNLSVRENIELGLKFRNQSAAVRSQKSTAMMENLGIQHLADRNSRELSGGEIQKVAIARALILEPDVLILDEPFTHLDRQAVGFFEGLIRYLCNDQHKTIVFTSHDQVAAQLLSDSIYSVLGGKLVPSAMTNLYYGKVVSGKHLFDTGRIRIHIPENITTGAHLTVEPSNLVLSREKLQSSMRNEFRGRIAALQEQQEQIQLTIEAGEKFYAVITHEAMNDLNIRFGETIWVSFKSSAVQVF